jgi:signal transduction histidine kinase
MIAISVENDGRAFSEERPGHGLDNMRRRARQLQGRLQIRPLGHGAEVTLLLPRGLPDVAAN